MTLVEPSVSTLGRLRTMAFLAAILRVPRARQVVMTTARPSGIAATANATAILNCHQLYQRRWFYVVNCASEPAAMSGIGKVTVIYEPYENADDTDNFS